MTQVGKVFHLKGKTRKTVKAIPFIKPDGSTGYTDNRKVAESFNARFGHLVLPARERSDGAA